MIPTKWLYDIMGWAWEDTRTEHAAVAECDRDLRPQTQKVQTHAEYKNCVSQTIAQWSSLTHIA